MKFLPGKRVLLIDFLFILVGLLLFSQKFVLNQADAQSNQIIVTTTPRPGGGNLQLQTFIVITYTPSPTPPITNLPTATSAPTPTTLPTATPTPGALPPPGGPIPITEPKIGGPNPPEGYYCIDDEDPDMCDDNSSHLVPKGAGGASGPCGTIIEQAHKLVMALPQDDKIDNGNGVRDYLLSTVSTSCGSTGPYAKGQYVSTMLVIDAFNLAGYKGQGHMDKSLASFVSPTGMFSFFNANPSGYEYIPYSPAVIQRFATGEKDLTGCVMFLKRGSSYHIGIVNKLEVYTQGGDGVISILQSGTKMYIDRFPVVGWSVQNDSTNQTTTDGVTGFGCHT